jgi:SnoaL-like domain
MPGISQWCSKERMDELARLAAIEDIKQLKARYFRCLDTKDWAGFEAVFADDAVLDTSEEADAVVHGAAAIVAYVRGQVGDVETVHHGHMPEISITSPSSASGIWAMEDMLRWPPGSPIQALHGYGHYHETYVLDGNGWRIASLRLTRLRRDLDFAG